MPRVLVTDPIAQDGLDLLASAADVEVQPHPSQDQLLQLIAGCEGLVVRSETKVTAEVIEAGKRLQVIGRAGSGVDNIDLEAATLRGVVVVNAPLGNIISAAEHTVALMLALARRLPEASTSLRAGRWERQDFVGVELRGRVLGLIGLGQVGSEVARRARGLEMRVLACDPYIAPDRAHGIGVELVAMDELFAQADLLSLHTRLTPATHDLIGEEQIAQMKPGVRIINTARGELIDEAALIRGLDSGKVAGAAIDVFREEPPGENPLLNHERVIVTPHLGALTREAQERVAVDVAQEVIAVLQGRPPRYAVNAPLVSPETMEVLAPYLEVAERTASVATQLTTGQLTSVEINYLGEIADLDVTPLKAAVIKGLLAPVSSENVTIVNANLIAQNRGLHITERKGPGEQYANLISVHVHTTEGETTVGGTVFPDGTRITHINDFSSISIPPGDGYLLICENLDRPGMVHGVSAVLDEHDINISFMDLGREKVRGRAMMVLGLDDEVPPEVLRKIETVPDLYKARLVKA